MRSAHDASAPSGIDRSHRLAELDAQLVTLHAGINAATARFCVLLEEFDRLNGWAEPGLLSCAHWLNWRCGIGLNAAREKVRVARALPGLPAIRRHFESGELSFSKVRALTRIATPDNEGMLLSVARHGTAHHVETLVRKWRSGQRAAALQEATARHAARRVTWHHDENGCLVIRAVLPPEEGAVVLEALQAAMDAAENAPADGGHRDIEGEAGAHGDGQDDRADVTAVNTVAADNTAVHTVDVTAVTLDETASPEQQRRADALLRLAEAWLGGEPGPGSAGDRYLVHVHVDTQALAACAGGASELHDGPGLAPDTVRRLCCDSGLSVSIDDEVGRPLNVGRKTRSIPPAMRRALDNRDQGCRFPGCTRTRWLHGHHVRHWADGGETSLNNLVSLCRRHHRLVHEGGFGVHANAEDGFVFTTPAGARVPRSAGSASDGVLPLKRIAAAQPVDVRRFPLWQGEPMDYDYAAELLARTGEGLATTNLYRDA
jgi:hypothetical protein